MGTASQRWPMPLSWGALGPQLGILQDEGRCHNVGANMGLPEVTHRPRPPQREK